MSAHTPGPWANSGFTTQASIAGFRVVFPEGGEQPPPIAYVAANADARLIAAAPSLLEAADAAIAYDAAIQRAASQGKSWVEGDDLDVLYADWIDKARLAIAKARALQPDSGPS